MKNKFVVALVAILSLTVLLTACLTEIEETVTVTFDADGGTPTPAAVELTRGGRLGNLPTPTKTGDEFVGWYNGFDEYTAGSVINADITLTAKWKSTFTPETVTVTFNSPSAVPATTTVTVTKGKALGPLFPIDPRQQGKWFNGWKSGATDFTKDSVVNTDTTVTANWTDKTVKHTVTLKVPTLHQEKNPGVNDTSFEVWEGDRMNDWPVNGKFPFPTEMKCADSPNPDQTYRFMRWSVGGNANGIIYTEKDIIEEDVTLTAYYVFNFIPRTFEVDLSTLNLTTNAVTSGTVNNPVRSPLADPSSYDPATGTVTATFQASPSFIWFSTPKALVDLIGGTSVPGTNLASVTNETTFVWELDADLKLADGTIVNGNDQYTFNIFLGNLTQNDNWNATAVKDITLDQINGVGETNAAPEPHMVAGTIVSFAQNRYWVMVRARNGGHGITNATMTLRSLKIHLVQ